MHRVKWRSKYTNIYETISLFFYRYSNKHFVLNFISCVIVDVWQNFKSRNLKIVGFFLLQILQLISKWEVFFSNELSEINNRKTAKICCCLDFSSLNVISGLWWGPIFFYTSMGVYIENCLASSRELQCHNMRHSIIQSTYKLPS